MHGVKVGKPGLLSPWGATIFPINLAWAATFDDALAQQAASQVGIRRPPPSPPPPPPPSSLNLEGSFFVLSGG